MYIITTAILFITLMLGGCGSEPKKEEPPETKIQVNIFVSAQVNPDVNGRPSPIVVRLYELKNIGKFEEADFYKLFEDHEGYLGSDLLASEKFHFKPGEIKALGHAVSPDTKYIAVTAAFRDFNQAVWRDFIAIESAKTTELFVVLESLNVTIKKQPK
ncbi:type VI secretion system lipoprotein TssJ [Methyloglobulus sp.]|uniref:type VI secretion system lipoprotein TssJ n=1 Tax=Methyloglobulus sp. TaxID=2518622 RepID=UPI00398A4176